MSDGTKRDEARAALRHCADVLDMAATFADDTAPQVQDRATPREVAEVCRAAEVAARAALKEG